MKRLIALLIPLACAWGAQHDHPAAGTSAPPQLLEGLGTHTHPIATPSKTAQQFFDQGLALIYGFNHDEAARLFEQAATLDPKSPMPHWGIALALGPNYNLPPMPEREEKAWKAITKAMELAAGAPANERAYIQALATRYSKDPNEDRIKLGVKYRNAMKAVTAQYPDDLDAATLYAEAAMDLRPWQLWSADGTPADGTLEIVEVLESVLRRDPNHPGANHYYIHAIEASQHPERALPSALRLGSLMPGAGHIVHMPSHIFLRVGDFEPAVTVNKAAAEVDRRYIERTGAKGIYPLMYYSHNLHFVAYMRSMQGSFNEALDYSRQLRRNVAGAIDAMPMLAPFGTFEWLTLTRFGKWNDMLAQPEPTEKDNYLNAMYRYSRGVALAGLGKVKEAEAEHERLLAIANRIPETEMIMTNSSRSILAIGALDLQARTARANGNTAAEIGYWRQAVELQDKLNYMEPPQWHYPVREALGGALLRAGDFRGADAVFRKDLELNPRNGRSLFGLLEALKKQGNSVGVEWVQKEFDEAWKHSEGPLQIADL
jgi:tetratricopeptide (TPR) repeat protein